VGIEAALGALDLQPRGQHAAVNVDLPAAQSEVFDARAYKLLAQSLERRPHPPAHSGQRPAQRSLGRNAREADESLKQRIVADKRQVA
jgi:hypothetical protein